MNSILSNIFVINDNFFGIVFEQRGPTQAMGLKPVDHVVSGCGMVYADGCIAKRTH